jgi:mRNA-degrading endonuclease RelE of RelBE toxin-antitoxin system
LLKEEEIEILWTSAFEKRWKHLGYKDSDNEELESLIAENPESSPIIRGTGGVRKLRLPLPGNKGKSSGSRICYYYQNSEGRVFLLVVFTKKEKANLSKKEKQQLKELVKKLK